jgi:hypothetical protein
MLIHFDFGNESLDISIPSASFEESGIHVPVSNPGVRLRDERTKSDLSVLDLRTFIKSGESDACAIADTNR